MFSGKVSVQKVKFSYRLFICNSIIYAHMCSFLHFMQLLAEEVLSINFTVTQLTVAKNN